MLELSPSDQVWDYICCEYDVVCILHFSAVLTKATAK
jgi:hypothetical protein